MIDVEKDRLIRTCFMVGFYYGNNFDFKKVKDELKVCNGIDLIAESASLSFSEFLENIDEYLKE